MRRPPLFSCAEAALLSLAASGCAKEASPGPPPEVVSRVEGEPVERTEIETLAAYLAISWPNYALDPLRSAALATSLMPRALVFARNRERVSALREKIERAKARLEAGEPFETVAKEVSDTDAEKGGDAGWTSRTDLDPLLGLEAFSAPLGEVRGPIRTKFGFHLIRVLERREAPNPRFSTVHLQGIVALLDPSPKSPKELARALEGAAIEILDAPFYERIRPVGVGVRFAPASRPAGGAGS